MPPKTPSQQRLMGAALAAKRGAKPASKQVAEVAREMSSKQLKEFATKPKGGYPGKTKKKK
jgi:Protein of unknwon function (DUF3008)